MPSHNLPILAFGLALALFGTPILLLTTRFAGGNSLGWPIRLSLWALGGAALGIARSVMKNWDITLGLLAPSWRTVIGAVAAMLITCAAWPIVQHIQVRAGKKTVEQNEAFLAITALSIPYRLFLVATAAVTEEILYRGFAVGVGGEILGNRPAAVALSLIAFVGGHFRWGLGHMLSVLWAAITLTALFVITRDLLACILAHGAIDVIGLVIAPAAMARRGRADGVAQRV
jgi:membrane protease YdiL (CAAX protease family)